MMRAGELRHRVTIQQKIVTRDTFGGEVVTWADVATVWAAVEPLRGREFLDAKQIQAETAYRVRMRYRSDVDTDMRIVWDSRTLEITAVLDVDGRGRELELMCREVV